MGYKEEFSSAMDEIIERGLEDLFAIHLKENPEDTPEDYMELVEEGDEAERERWRLIGY